MRSLHLIVLLVLAGAGSLAAQAVPALTLDQVYRRLEERSPRVRAADARTAAARARIKPAGRWPDPELQLGLMNRDLPGLGINEVTGMNQIQVMQMVPTAGKTGLAVRAARAGAEAEEAASRETAWEVRAEGAMRFYEVYRADESLAAMREARRLLAGVLRTTEAMYAQGEGRQADVLRAQVEQVRMDDEILRMEAMRAGAALRLAALLYLDDTEPLPPLVPPLLPESLPPREALVSGALANRPMLEAGSARIRAAQAMTRMAGREIWPDLTFGLIYGNRPMPMGGLEHMASFMVGFTLPINAGSRQRQVEAEARAMTAMAEADLEEMQLETRARVGELHAEFDRARRLSSLYRHTLLPQLEVTAAASVAAYRSGAVDFMTLLDNQMAVAKVRQEIARADAEAGIALAELEMLTAARLTHPVLASGPGGTE